MKYGVTKLSIVPGREEPSDKSQMVTQLLFGEHYKILEQRSKWSKVRLAYDNYECWIDNNQCFEISEKEYTAIEGQKSSLICHELTQLLKNSETKNALPVVLGSTLAMMNRQNQLKLGGEEYIFIGSSYKPAKPNREILVDFARKYLNTPYLWGGRSPFGIDCSGFTQMVYKMIGVKLPRDAYQQAELGDPLSFIEEAEPGDLAFFDNNDGDIIHVGIMLKDNHIIHASGKVRIDRIDHQGIHNGDTGKYTHKMRLIKRVL